VSSPIGFERLENFPEKLTLDSDDIIYAGDSTDSFNEVKVKKSNIVLSTSQLSGTLQAAQFPALTGDVTTSAGSLNTVIGTGKVTNAMLAGSIAASKLVGTDIATVGTITTGAWNATIITGQYGGTGIANTGLTINLSTGAPGKILFSDNAGNAAWSTIILPSTIAVNDLIYASSLNTLSALSAANNAVLVTSGSGVPSLSSPGNGTAISGSTLSANINTTNLKFTAGAIDTIQGISSVATPTFASLTVNGDLAATGNLKCSTFQMTTGASTGYVMQSDLTGNGTWQPVSTVIPGAALTRTNDTNVTLTLGGSPNTALVNAASLTLGWTGQLGLTRGGTNASLTASNGGILYSTASALAILAGTATANQILLSGANTTPAWSTATYPATTTINQVLYSSSNNVIAGVSASNNGVLISGTTGIPSWLAAGTTGQVLIATTSNPPSWGAISSVAIVSVSGTANQISTSTTSGAVTLSLSSTIITPGTLAINAMTQGSVLFAGASSVVSQDNANFFWDATNHRLGLGSTSPPTPIYLSNPSPRIALFDNDNPLSASNPTWSIRAQDDGTFRLQSSADNSNFTNRITVDSSGNMGVGTTSPGAVIHGFTTSTGHPSLLRLESTTNSFGSSDDGARLEFYTFFSGNSTHYFQSAIQAIDENTAGQGSGAGGLAFLTYNNAVIQESARITSDGRLLVGATSSGSLFAVAGSASIGSGYAASTAPSNGAIIQGQLGVGQFSPNSNCKAEFYSTTAYNILCNGTQAGVDSNSYTNSIYINNLLQPTNGATLVAGIHSEPNISAPSGKTITFGCAAYLAPNFLSNVGTITTMLGLYIGLGPLTATGTISNAYNLYVSQPLASATGNYYAASIQGGLVLHRSSTATDYTVKTGDTFVAVTNTSAGRTISLPATVPDAGWIVIIKDESGGAATHNIVISGNGHNLDGGASGTIVGNYAAARIYSNGTQYYSW
jgi:hypothetical protein